jgi:adenylate cyclase class 2
MGIEIEKKYRLTGDGRRELTLRLEKMRNAVRRGSEFEENTLYTGRDIDTQTTVLRLRRVGGKGILTYKRRLPSDSTVRRQIEEETEVADSAALANILAALNFRPALVYEKKRETWELGEVELVIDELPFGLYVEIEGEEDDILNIEKILGLDGAVVEPATYPELAVHYGVRHGEVIEARF